MSALRIVTGDRTQTTTTRKTTKKRARPTLLFQFIGRKARRADDSIGVAVDGAHDESNATTTTTGFCYAPLIGSSQRQKSWRRASFCLCAALSAERCECDATRRGGERHSRYKHRSATKNLTASWRRSPFVIAR